MKVHPLLTGMLRSPHVRRLYNAFPWRLRAPTLQPLKTSASGSETFAHDLRRWANNDADVVCAKVGAHSCGLTDAEVQVRLHHFGPNSVELDKPLTAQHRLWHSYRNPFNLSLTGLAALSSATGDLTASVVLLTMVALATLIRFFHEKRTSRAADKLRSMVSRRVTVLRRQSTFDATTEHAGGNQHASGQGWHTTSVEVPPSKLVPGDIVLLRAGDMIPADCRILSAKALFVSQVTMTGESIPVEKCPTARCHAKDPAELSNIVLMGTSVVCGTATALVLHTGRRTYFGELASHVTARQRVSAFQTGVNETTGLLMRVALVIVPIVLLVNGVTKGNWLEALLFAMSVAVGLMPEMLPMIVTSALARGATRLIRRQVIVKQLDAIQNFGAMNVLCMDKTGTLTQDKVALEKHTNALGQTSDDVLNQAYLNSLHQTGLNNPLDQAVLMHVQAQQGAPSPASLYQKVDEVPYDFRRRCMSVIIADTSAQEHMLICKGAVDEVLDRCTHIDLNGVQMPLDIGLALQTRRVVRDFNQSGSRVLAVATKRVPMEAKSYATDDEKGLVLIGYITFLDPPKDSTAPALRALARHGIATKILTGDNELVTTTVCRRIGFPVQGVLPGTDVQRMDDAALSQAVESHNVFVRLAPLQKERIVRALHANGHIVGFIGDGINDAPALRAADIGISVDTAVDVAKEAADIVLQEKSLMVLEAGIIEGRRVFCNMLKYVRMTASSNFGNVFSLLVASAFLPFLPMLPLQLLLQNLLYEVALMTIPFDYVDNEQVAAPLKWNPNDIARFMFFFGPISSVFDIVTYLLMWFVFDANSANQQPLFQAGWFVIGLITQTAVVHMIRTPKLPFVQSCSAPSLTVATCAVIAIAIFLPMGPLAAHFKLQALPLTYFPWMIAIIATYAMLTIGMKQIYIRRFGW